MRGNPQKVYKFIRKQYQASEEVNPKKQENGKNKDKDPRNSKPMSIEEERLRRNLDYFNFDQPIVDKNVKHQSVSSPKTRPLIQQGTKDDEERPKDEEFKIQFDKKLTKVMMPDQLEKIKLIRKIENRLLSCLDKKKPQVSVKQLISEQALIEILGKKERRLITKNGNYKQKIDVEADSVRKVQHIGCQHEDKSRKIKNTRQNNKDNPQKGYANQSVFNVFEEDINFQKPVDQQPYLNFNSENLFENQQSFFDYELQKYKYFPNSIPQKDQDYYSYDLFASQKKSFPQKDHREKNRYDLRNLKIPKISQGQAKKWRKQSIEPIPQVLEEDKLNFYFSSDKSDQNSLFRTENYIEKNPVRGSDRFDSKWDPY